MPELSTQVKLSSASFNLVSAVSSLQGLYDHLMSMQLIDEAGELRKSLVSIQHAQADIGDISERR
jgi:hypothetical protein